LSSICGGYVRRKHFAGIVSRAGVALAAPAAWLLMRLDEHSGVPLEQLAHHSPYDVAALRRAAGDLRHAALVEGGNGDGTNALALTDRGCETLGRIVSARRAHIEEVFGQWSDSEREELAALIKRVSRELVPEVHTGRTGEMPVVR
jgi:DNA-binding MarR family transcriptional regulator